MRPIVDALLLRALPLALSGLCVWPAAVPARGEVTPDVAVEIARLRSRLADTAAREQHCLVGATQPVWTASLGRVREHGTAELDQDLTRLQGHCRALSAQWRQTRADASAGAQVLKAALDTLRRRHTAALESEPVRAAADPTQRAVEALVAAADAW